MADIATYANGLLIEFADAAHQELTRVLREKFGDQWLAQGVRKHFKEEQFAKVEKMFQNPMRVIDMGKNESELHGLEHFWQIINGNWKLFEICFGDRKRTEVYFSEIAELRHNLSHRMGHHVLLKNDLIRIVENCRMLLSALDSPHLDRFTKAVDSLVASGTPWGTSLGGHLPPRDEIYSEFVGRPSELKVLGEWLASDSPQILVWGYGGAGKSALAYRFARDVKDGSSEALIAVGWVSAKKSEYVEGMVQERRADFRDIDSLVTAIWAALYGPEDEPAKEGTESLIRELNDMPMLLIVDDFDTISEDEALSEFLLHNLRNTRTRVIYTSRHRVPGIKNLEVPPFTELELKEFVSNRTSVYGANKEQCLRRAQSIMSVTDGYPLFVDDFIHHAALIGVDEALRDWSQRRGDAARQYALRRQVEYLGHSSGEVLIALSIAGRALIPVEISNIAGLTDADAEAGLRELLRWRMVNRATADGSSSPAYRMNANTSRLVQQTYRDDHRLRTFSTAFKSLSGERVPEAKKNAIGRVIARSTALLRTDSFESSREHLLANMSGELADSPDLHGVLGWLHSTQRPLESQYENAKRAFDFSYKLGSRKIDMFYHWLMMENNMAELLIDRAHEQPAIEGEIAEHWRNCGQIADWGVQRCGSSQLLCYWAGYAAGREAKASVRTQQFNSAHVSYERSLERLKRALDGAVSDVAAVPRGNIYRGLVLAYEGLGDWPNVEKTLSDWLDFSGRNFNLEIEWRRLVGKHRQLWYNGKLRRELAVQT